MEWKRSSSLVGLSPHPAWDLTCVDGARTVSPVGYLLEKYGGKFMYYTVKIWHQKADVAQRQDKLRNQFSYWAVPKTLLISSLMEILSSLNQD